MSRILEPGEVKALFRQLVKASGGVDAAGVELGVTHQRVSQLQNVNCPDEPTFRQIMALEAVCGRLIVTEAHALAVKGQEADSLGRAAVESVGDVAEALSAIHTMDADGHRCAGEIRVVQQAAQRAADRVSQLAAATARLQPGEVA